MTILDNEKEQFLAWELELELELTRMPFREWKKTFLKEEKNG